VTEKQDEKIEYYFTDFMNNTRDLTSSFPLQRFFHFITHS